MSHILIAEDEVKIATFLEKGLRSNGFATTTVADGETAYQYARGGGFDLVVLDLGLPVRDGLSVLKALRQEAVHTPVVVLTARDSTADTVAGLESGADDYMPKPFAFDELLAASGSACDPRAPPSRRPSRSARSPSTCRPDGPRSTVS